MGEGEGAAQTFCCLSVERWFDKLWVCTCVIGKHKSRKRGSSLNAQYLRKCCRKEVEPYKILNLIKIYVNVTVTVTR